MSDRLVQRVVQHAVRHVVRNVGRIVEQSLGRSFGRSFDRSLARNIGQTLVRIVIDRPANGKLGAQYRDGVRADCVLKGTEERRSTAQMARLRMRLIRIGDRDGLGTSEATHTRGGPFVSGSRSAHRHDLAGREIVGIRNWVLGADEGIVCRPHNGSTGWEPRRRQRIFCARLSQICVHQRSRPRGLLAIRLSSSCNRHLFGGRHLLHSQPL